jgi:hypothetical protein
MAKAKLSLLSDWPFCISVLLAALGVLPLAVLLGTPPDQMPFLASPLALWVGFWLLVAGWRILLVRRINREGVVVEARVDKVRIHGGRTRTVWVTYDYDGAHVSTRFSPWGFPPSPEEGGQVQLVIDPRKPTRCWVYKG